VCLVPVAFRMRDAVSTCIATDWEDVWKHDVEGIRLPFLNVVLGLLQAAAEKLPPSFLSEEGTSCSFADGDVLESFQSGAFVALSLFLLYPDPFKSENVPRASVYS
jgi:hypothetical protein